MKHEKNNYSLYQRTKKFQIPLLEMLTISLKSFFWRNSTLNFININLFQWFKLINILENNLIYIKLNLNLWFPKENWKKIHNYH